MNAIPDARETNAPLAPVRLSFPKRWTCEVPANPHADAVSEAVLGWLVQSGAVVPGTRLAETARAIAPGEFVGYAFPRAGFDRLLDIGKLWTAQLLWDDLHVEGANSDETFTDNDLLAWYSLERPFPSRGIPSSWRPLLQCIAEVLETMRAKHGIEYVRHHARGIVEWYRAAGVERYLAEKFRSGAAGITFHEYFVNRSVTVGSTAGMSIEYVYDLPATAEFHADGRVGRMRDLAAGMCAVGNDLWSLGKDLAEGWPNVVTVRMQLERLTLAEAMAATTAMHAEHAAAFDALAGEIEQDAAFASQWPFAAQYFTHMRLYTSGVNVWESRAERYRRDNLVVGGERMELSLAFRRSGAYAVLGAELEGTPGGHPPLRQG